MKILQYIHMLYLNLYTYYKVKSQILEILDQYYFNFYVDT